MKKAVLITIYSKHIKNIFNGEKTLEIRKTVEKEWADYLNCKTDKKPAPKKYYIYCAKQGDSLVNLYYLVEKRAKWEVVRGCKNVRLNGFVVAEFTLKEAIKIFSTQLDEVTKYVCENACLDEIDLFNYLDGGNGYVLHIDNLKIFDKPRPLKKFRKLGAPSYEKLKPYIELGTGKEYTKKMFEDDTIKAGFSIKVAPQSWCYCEEAD